MMQWIRIRWQQWIINHHPRKNRHLLDRHHLYVLPSTFGWIFALAILGLFVGAINYQVSAVFLLTFLLGVCAMMSAWLAHQNLQAIKIACLDLEDCACGDNLSIKLILEVTQNTRFDVNLHFHQQSSTATLETLSASSMIELKLKTDKRGVYQLPLIRLYTRYPLGLFTVWSWLGFKQHYVVYPKPYDPGYWPVKQGQATNMQRHTNDEEELQELRQVDNPSIHRSRIAWKIAARGQGWFVKILQDLQGEQWIFRLADIEGHDRELKLRILSHWLISAEKMGVEYALQLANEPILMHRGNLHLRRCLRELAVFK